MGGNRPAFGHDARRDPRFFGTGLCPGPPARDREGFIHFPRRWFANADGKWPGGLGSWLFFSSDREQSGWLRCRLLLCTDGKGPGRCGCCCGGSTDGKRLSRFSGGFRVCRLSKAVDRIARAICWDGFFKPVKYMCALDAAYIALAKLQLLQGNRKNGFTLGTTCSQLHGLTRTSVNCALAVQADPSVAGLPDFHLSRTRTA